MRFLHRKVLGDGREVFAYYTTSVDLYGEAMTAAEIVELWPEDASLVEYARSNDAKTTGASGTVADWWEVAALDDDGCHTGETRRPDLP